MKTIKIMIISLLLVATQAFAWGKGERSALLGFTAGAVLTHFVSNYDNNSYQNHSNKRVYVQEPREVVYVNRYERHEEFREHCRRPHHYRNRFLHNNYDKRYDREYSKRHHHKHNRIVVHNNYRTNYYY